MNTSTLTTSTVPAVRFGINHGYHFAADLVELNATFVVANRSAYDRSWALQLWACPSVPARTDDLVGHLVAEAPLPPIAEISGETEPFMVSAISQPPAGDRDHSMVLVLAARRGAGAFDEVHDVASFPTRERFVLPRFAGAVMYSVHGDRVKLEVEAIENPRDSSNLSGTISLELWALPAPYSGGRFTGAALSGAILGTLGGQERWSALALDLPYTEPAAGQWHVVAMVREWTGAGYTTRDFANLGVLASAVAPSSLAADPSVPATELAAASTPIPVSEPATDQPVVATTKPSADAPAKSAKPVAPARGKISLNSATLEQLTSVKGLPRAVAERILRDRPFTSVDALMNVKGMGAKLLAKLRDQLTV